MSLIQTPTSLENSSQKALPTSDPEKGTSLLRKSFQKFMQNKMAVFCCLLIICLYLISIAASLFAPYSFDEGELEAQNLPPTWYRLLMNHQYVQNITQWAETENGLGIGAIDFSKLADGEAFSLPTSSADPRPDSSNLFDRSLDHLEPAGILLYFQNKGTWTHLMGTDEIGQDIFSRVIYGMRLSLFLALTVTFFSMLIGISYGSISGYFGGLVDTLMMRFVDFLFGVPVIFLVILLMVFFGRHIYLIFIGLSLVYWIVLARIVRGQVLSLKEREFVLAAVSNGVKKHHIIFKHLVPNVVGPVIVFSTLLVPQIMLLEAFLSFIGLGVSPPDVSLGILISDGAAVISSYSWPILFPGIIFSIMIFCMNFIGDGLRDALDPKSMT